jgi:hypothetical protein
MTTVLTTLAALAGVGIGATLQFAFGQLLERKKQFIALRSQSYVDFVNAASAVAHAQRSSNIDAAAAALAALTEAKVRISIYGTKGVVAALAVFTKGDQNLATFGAAVFSRSDLCHAE